MNEDRDKLCEELERPDRPAYMKQAAQMLRLDRIELTSCRETLEAARAVKIELQSELEEAQAARDRYKEGLEEIKQARGHIYMVEDLREMACHHLKKVPPSARQSLTTEDEEKKTHQN